VAGLKRFFRAIGSPWLGVVLLALVAAAVFVGLVIPQSGKPGLDGGMRAARAGFDIFRSPFFVILLAALGVNMFFHVVLRGWELLAEMTSPGIPAIPPDALREELGLRDDPKAIAACSSLLERLGFKVVRVERDAARRICAEKGPLWAWGSQVVHAGFLVLLLGGAVSLKTRSKEYIFLREGSATAVRGAAFMVQANPPEIQFWRRTGEPKTYSSRLTILEGGQERVSKRVSVNDPLSYAGVRIIQAGYRFTGDLRLVRLGVTGEGVEGTAVVSLKPGRKLRMGGTGYLLAVEEFEPDFFIDPAGKTGSRSAEFHNPAALVVFYKGSRKIGEAWAFSEGMTKHSRERLLGVELEDFDPVMETGLMMVRDKGEPFFWTGAILLIAGLIFSLGFSRKRVWLDFPRQAGERGVMFGDAGGRVYHFGKEFREMAAIFRSVT